jgi:hypothetical protein
VSEGVVDPLEVVQVEENERERATVALGLVYATIRKR